MLEREGPRELRRQALVSTVRQDLQDVSRRRVQSETGSVRCATPVALVDAGGLTPLAFCDRTGT